MWEKEKRKRKEKKEKVEGERSYERGGGNSVNSTFSPSLFIFFLSFYFTKNKGRYKIFYWANHRLTLGTRRSPFYFKPHTSTNYCCTPTYFVSIIQ
jgi:hypothetical protein